MQNQGNPEQLRNPVVNLVPADLSRLALTQGAEGLASDTTQVSDEIPKSSQNPKQMEQNLANPGEGSNNVALMTSATEDPNHSEEGSTNSKEFEDTVEDARDLPQNQEASQNTASSTPYQHNPPKKQSHLNELKGLHYSTILGAGENYENLPKRKQTAPLEVLRNVFDSAIQKADAETQSFLDQRFPPATAGELPVSEIRPRLKELRFHRHAIVTALGDLSAALTTKGHPTERSDADKAAKEILNLLDGIAMTYNECRSMTSSSWISEQREHSAELLLRQQRNQIHKDSIDYEKQSQIDQERSQSEMRAREIERQAELAKKHVDLNFTQETLRQQQHGEQNLGTDPTTDQRLFPANQTLPNRTESLNRTI